jgi:hypothetical protein
MKLSKTLVLLLLVGAVFSAYAGSPLKGLSGKSDSDKKTFIKKEVEHSPSHIANAQQNIHMSMNNPKNDQALYKEVKKIAVLGMSVAVGFADGVADREEQGLAGIPYGDYDILANGILESIYKGIESEGYQVIKLEDVMKTPSYASVNYGEWDGKLGNFGKNCWVTTPLKSKWIEPDVLNNISSAGSLMTRGDVRKKNALERNAPLQKLVQEAGADAGVVLTCRILIYKGEYQLGFGGDRRSFVIDMIPAQGESRIVWSAYFKNFVELDFKATKTDTKTGAWKKSWGYDLNAAIPDLKDALFEAASISAYKLKHDQSE